MAEAVVQEPAQDGVTAHPQDADLFPKLVPYLDRHLVYPILEFMDKEEIRPHEEMVKFKIELLKDTNMIDFVNDLVMEDQGLDKRPAEFAKRRDEILKRRDQYHEETDKLEGIFEDEEITTRLRSDRTSNLNFLKEGYGITEEAVAALYDFAQFTYNQGDYPHASQLLFHYRFLAQDTDKADRAQWGRLACEILSANWEDAMDTLKSLKEQIDQGFFNQPLQQLNQRTWLLHWALFPFFYHHDDKARDDLTEIFLSVQYINTVQTSSPWLLRYLATAVISSRNRTGGGRSGSGGGASYQKQVKDLVRIVRQEMYEYRDPVTEFLRALYVDFDFEEAQRKLREAADILQRDFFLKEVAESFVEAARHLISELYCKIHQRIDIKDLSTRLGLSQDEGEKWIVNLIRDTRVDAKIDYKEGTVVMNHPPQSVYQQVIERTKGGFFRTQVLSAAVAR